MLQVDVVEALKSFICMWAGPSPVTPVLPLLPVFPVTPVLPVSPVTPVFPVAPVPPTRTTIPPDSWEAKWYREASIRGSQSHGII